MQNTNNLVNLLNPGNVNPNANAKPGARLNAPPLPDISFNQVLSREIAQPAKAAITAAPAPTPNKNTGNSANSAKNTNNANSPNSPNSSTQSTSANSSANASNSANNTNNVNQSAESSTAPTEKSTSTGKTDEASGKEAATSTDTANNSAQNEFQAASQIDPTAALLALVASVGNHPAAGKAGSTAAVAEVVNGEAASTELPDSLATAQLITAGTPGSLTPDAGADSSADIPGGVSTVLAKETAIEADKGKANPAEPKLAKIQAEPTDSGSKATNSAAPTESFAAVQSAATTRRASAGETLSTGKEGPATPIAGAKTVSSVETAPALAKLQQTVAPRVGNPGWDQALGQRVVYMAGNGQQTASLSLNPPELGPLQVQLTFSNDQTSASFTAAQPEVRQALEAALPKLREMMSEAGIQLGSATVGTSLPNQQQSTPGEQSRSHQQSGKFDSPTPDNSLKPVKTTVIREALGVVDTFV
jgi:flagellar hook-length control protein FliK